MLYSIVLVSTILNVNQLQVLYVTSRICLPSPTPAYPSRLSQSTRLSSLCHTAILSIFPLAIYFTYGNLCFHATGLSICPNLSVPTLSTSLFSVNTYIFISDQNKQKSVIANGIHMYSLQQFKTLLFVEQVKMFPRLENW